MRPTQVEDADFVLALVNTPKWLKHIGNRNVNTREEAVEYIKNRMLPQLVTHGFSNNTVIRKSDGALVGSCGLYDREGLEGVDIGYAFLEEYEGFGYATEAALKMKDLAINTFGLKLIKAITTEENVASQRVLKKIGFEFVERIRIPNDPEELLLFKYIHPE